MFLIRFRRNSLLRCTAAKQTEWHSGTKRQRQEFWTEVVHSACSSLLKDDVTEGDEEFRGHLRRLTKENNVPRKRCPHREDGPTRLFDRHSIAIHKLHEMFMLAVSCGGLEGSGMLLGYMPAVARAHVCSYGLRRETTGNVGFMVSRAVAHTLQLCIYRLREGFS